MHNHFHFNRKVRPSVYFKGRKLLEYYRRLVKEASATSGQRLLAAYYYFCRELIRRRDA